MEKPAIVNKWSWGAAALNIVYGFGNKAWMTLVALIPAFLWSAFIYFAGSLGITSAKTIYIILGALFLLYIGLCIFCGLKGHQWAWNHKNYPDEYFETVQKTWDRAGLIFFIIIMVLFAVSIIRIIQTYRLLHSMYG